MARGSVSSGYERLFVPGGQNAAYSNSSSTALAYESDEVISSEEQAKAEEIRRSEIAEQYSIYEPYGMTYDVWKSAHR